ncbi:ICP22 family protein [Natronolimnohabitans innermongolicus]|uniref:Uncharacterized protein n=1 Tax=Natronolimnohabitans innermongolicus JCM 12255 TaxID=1227499 RepID=L9WXA8_9EURY|nr:hypothetical protein [Natronolimnohabitans innermongolicus]ELY54032.1 hypothetical protein C493_13318 [Natronolimnohabitans innermongolicus JCM 12255]
MTALESRLETDGFGPFFRSYTRTWIHAVATAGLTAFGTLTFVNNWFAALALASYVVPPVALYLRYRNGTAKSEPEPSESAESTSETADPVEAEPEPSESVSTAGSESTGESVGSDSSAVDEPADDAERSDAEATTAKPDDGAEEPAVEVEHSPDGDEEPGKNENGGPDAAPTPDVEPPEWRAVDVPTDATLRDVVAGPTGAYAVGDGGAVLADDGGDGDGPEDGDPEWTVVLEDGPATGSNDLRGVDATDDGAAVWVAGDSGALGRIDTETGRHTDYTAPADVTDNWLGVAVAGAGGAETILVINGSGAVLRGEYRDGDLEWTGPDKPGSGSSFSGIALFGDGGGDGETAVGYCCDTNDGVYETVDGGETFERVGLEGADGTLTGVATTGRGNCLVSADDGVVHRYDGTTWTPERVLEGALSGIARDGERTAAAADDGRVYEREGAAVDWNRSAVELEAPLLAVSLEANRTVAVGESGAVLECA